jgi:hypothetical protein
MPNGVPALKPFVVPKMDFAERARLQGQQQEAFRSQLQGQQLQQQLTRQKMTATEEALARQEINSINDTLGRVNSQETLDSAKNILKMQFPNDSQTIDQVSERFFPGGQYSQQGQQALTQLFGQVAQQVGEPFTLKPGERRFGPTGEEIAAVPAAPKKETKKDFQLFETELGELQFLEKGAEIPPGARPFVPDKGEKGASVDQIFKIRKQVSTNPIVKDFLLIDSQSKRLDTAVKDVQEQRKAGRIPNFIAVDQALITILNKMLDPTSVVRESEYARTPSDQAALSRIKGSFQQLVTGGAKLDDPDRDAVLRMARSFAKIARNRLNPEINSIKKTLIKFKIDPDDVISPVLVADDPQSDLFFNQRRENIPNITTQEQYNALPPGSVYLEDGAQYRKP